jgi:GNAT superfamily N-acetyltransferase
MVLWEKDFALLVDIALLGEYRQQGIGGRLLCELIEQCNRLSVRLRLQVSKNNPALRFYERLGFICQDDDQMYIQMERRPEGLPSTANRMRFGKCFLVFGRVSRATI